MIDKLFDTEAKRTAAVIKFQSLLDHPGWHLIVAMLDANIQNLQEQLDDPESEDTLEEIKLKRRMKAAYIKLRNEPMSKIREFTSAENPDEPNDDPYETVKGDDPEPES